MSKRPLNPAARSFTPSPEPLSIAGKPELIDPVGVGGIARTASGFHGRQFETRCPPDVQPRTRIVAVCGIPNVKNYSDPKVDGWFHSDFYLFFHLLQDVRDQIWLTCANPRTLVEDFKQYVHGSPKENDRRIVLDAKLLPRIEESGKLRVVPANELLDRFEATVRHETIIAAQNDQSVLVLVFGHGDYKGYGVCVGGAGGQGRSIPRLTVHRFKLLLDPKAQVSLLMTSCFSGGWLITPEANESSVIGGSRHAKLNITAMTATDAHNESDSWAQSESLGRAGGSVWATALLHSLIETEVITPDGPGLPIPLSSYAEDEVRNQIDEAPTYVQLAESIHKAVDQLRPGLEEHNYVTFSAQDDTWGTEWRTRTGFPLLGYEKRWKELELVQAGVAQDSYRTGGGISNASKNVVYSRVLAYMESLPGDPTSGQNSDNRRFRMYLDGELGDQDDEQLEYYSRVIEHRISKMEQATEYVVGMLNPDFCECERFDMDDWFIQRGKDHSAKSNRSTKRYKEIYKLVFNSKVFNEATPFEGFWFSKPVKYLAIALAESDLEMPAIKSTIAVFEQYRQSCNHRILNSRLGIRLTKDAEVARSIGSFRATLRPLITEFKRKWRSISPRKRNRSSVSIPSAVSTTQL